MRLGNRDGAPVDPVPFFVVASLAFAFVFAFGPAYGLSLGLSLNAALAGSTVVFLGAATVAYHRLVWAVNPAIREEVPAEIRIRKLFYAGIAILLLLSFLSLLQL